MRLVPREAVRWRLLFAAVAAAVGGCALGGGERVPVAIYQLVLSAEFAPQPVASSCGVLEVRPLEPAPGFGSSRMIYTREPYRLEHYAFSEWADSPARMITPLLIEALERTGQFEAVIGTPAPVTADLRLEAEGLALRQVFEDGTSRARLDLRVVLVETAERRLLGQRSLSVEAAADGDPAGGVRAANRALADLAAQVVAFTTDAAAGAAACGGSAAGL